MSNPDKAIDPGAIAVPSLHALIDTNVILDWLLQRMPWVEEARALWKAQATGLVVGHVPASAVTDIFYIARRARDIPTAFDCTDRVLASFEVATVDKDLLRIARGLSGNDFEDNVQIACAQAAGADIIVTRDANGFANAPIPVVTPPDIVRYLPHT